MLTDQQIARYSRQIILPSFGGKGQQRLLSASVAIVGTGAMADMAALYVAAAGIGALSLIGRDRVAGEDIESLNPDCEIAFSPSVTPHVAGEVARRHDVIVDAGAQSAVTEGLNAACVALRKPFIWGRALGNLGRLAVLAGHRGNTPCYGCLQRHDAGVGLPHPDCVGLSGVVAGFVGTLQATEVIKLVLALDPANTGRLVTYDALDMTVRAMDIARDPCCATCGGAEVGKAGSA